MSCDLEDGHVVPEHVHPEHQLAFASGGVLTVHTSQGAWVTPSMRAVWIPAGVPHSVAMAGRVRLRTLYFHPGLVRGLSAECVVMNVSPLLKELILYACTFPKLRKRVAVERRIIEVIVDQLVAARWIPLQLPRPSDPRALRIVRAMLEDPGRNRTLDGYCRGAGASKRTAQRLFLAETSMTFRQWRQQLRLLHALQRLASGETVTTAASRAGYASTSAFISMFKRCLGKTPTRYFKNDRAGKEASTPPEAAPRSSGVAPNGFR
ncbi:MAG: helix-turn-helix transcriptional regulator, partial [Thermoanaerobaculia bacterium]